MAKRSTNPGRPTARSAGSVKQNAADKRENFVARSALGDYRSDADLRGRIPDDILDSYECHQWKHAGAILATDFPRELEDIVEVLRSVRLRKRDIVVGGGGKSPYTQSVDKAFKSRGWTPKRWETAIVVDGSQSASPTHEVDCFKNRIGLELEWSNKDPFYDRDLNNFRLLFDLRVVSVGVMITKSDELAGLLDSLGVWSKYGTTTTWMSKLLPRIRGGGGGGCPLLVFGIRTKAYVES